MAPFILARAMAWCRGVTLLMRRTTLKTLFIVEEVRAWTGLVETLPIWTPPGLSLVVRQCMPTLNVVPVTFTMPQPGIMCILFKQSRAMTSLFLATRGPVLWVRATKEQESILRVSRQFLPEAPSKLLERLLWPVKVR